MSDQYPKRPDPMPAVYISWVDSRGIDGWRTTDDIDELLDKPDRLDIGSIGWLYEEREDWVTIVQNHGPGQAMGIITIPRIAIKTMQTLGLASIARSSG